MSTTNQSTPIAAGPPPTALRTICNLLARFRWSVRHYGPTLGTLALDAVEQPVREHQLALGLAIDSAAALDTAERGFCAKITAIFADGVVDLRERRWLRRHLPAHLAAHTTHTQKLKDLV